MRVTRQPAQQTLPVTPLSSAPRLDTQRRSVVLLDTRPRELQVHVALVRVCQWELVLDPTRLSHVSHVNPNLAHQLVALRAQPHDVAQLELIWVIVHTERQRARRRDVHEIALESVARRALVQDRRRAPNVGAVRVVGVVEAQLHVAVAGLANKGQVHTAVDLGGEDPLAAVVDDARLALLLHTGWRESVKLIGKGCARCCQHCAPCAAAARRRCKV